MEARSRNKKQEADVLSEAMQSASTSRLEIINRNDVRNCHIMAFKKLHTCAVTAGKHTSKDVQSTFVETNVGGFLGQVNNPPVRNVGCLPETKAIYISVRQIHISALGVKSWDGVFSAGQMYSCG